MAAEDLGLRFLIETVREALMQVSPGSTQPATVSGVAIAPRLVTCSCRTLSPVAADLDRAELQAAGRLAKADKLCSGKIYRNIDDGQLGHYRNQHLHGN